MSEAECTHHWMTTSPCPSCQDIVIERLVAERDAARAALLAIVRSAEDRTINNRPSGLVHVHRHIVDHARALLEDTGGE